MVLLGVVGWGLSSTVVGSVASPPARPWSPWLPHRFLPAWGSPVVLVAWLTSLAGGPCCVRSPAVGGSPLPLAGGRCGPVWGNLLPGLVVAPWPLWSVFAGRGLSRGWAGWSPGFLAVGPVGAVRGAAWPGVCPPRRGVCSPLWAYGCCSCCPSASPGWWACPSWVGRAPPMA